jgi:hypothetical protein
LGTEIHLTSVAAMGFVPGLAKLSGADDLTQDDAVKFLLPLRAWPVDVPKTGYLIRCRKPCPDRSSWFFWGRTDKKKCIRWTSKPNLTTRPSTGAPSALFRRQTACFHGIFSRSSGVNPLLIPLPSLTQERPARDDGGKPNAKGPPELKLPGGPTPSPTTEVMTL